jgi:2-desacetyl-2-hydroxyethyl bacteriochlorophyllide A dehydrogenase
MKAVIWTAYGPPEVLQLRDIVQPVPADDQVLVKVVVSNIFPGDCELRRFDVRFPWGIPVRLFCGLFKPRAGFILGQEYAGEVVATGSAVTRFKPGDRIFGAVEPFVHGSYAELLVTRANAATTIPETIAFADAAVLPTGGFNALHFLRVAELDKNGTGKKVLLNGACGSIGTLAVQLAKLHGAEVTVVDCTHKLDKLRELGADKVIDYTREDFTQVREHYDVVIDICGKAPFFRALRSVKPGGMLVLGNPPFHHLLFRLWCGLFSKAFGNKRVRFALAGYKLADLEHLKQLLAEGKLKAVIDRRYPLEQVAQGHRYVDSNQRVGNVVLDVSAAP